MGRVEAAGLLGVLRGEGRKAGVRLGDVGGEDDGGSEAGELGVKGGKFGLGHGGSLPSDAWRNGMCQFTLAGISEKKVSLNIPDVEEKIKKLEWEIREIRSKDPYQYKNLISKPELVREKHLDLQRQAEEYRQYSAQLDEKLSMILPEGSFLFWSDEWWGEA